MGLQASVSGREPSSQELDSASPRGSAGSTDEGAKQPTGPHTVTGEPLWVVIRAVKAELFRTFASVKGFTNMAPYIAVQWHADDRPGWEARTCTDPRPGLSFQWNHTFREQPYPGEQKGHRVKFDMWHERLGGWNSATLCGSACSSLDELLEGCRLPSGEASVTRARTMELTLRKKTEDTGVLTIQAMLVRHPTPNRQRTERLPRTQVDPDMFEDNVERLGVSGGTAPFFRLTLRPEAALRLGPDRSKEYFIGKDLSHATDELDFYEEAMLASRQTSGGGLEGLSRFMFEYAGVLSCSVKGVGPVELLVMRNLHDECKKMRMLDIKIGQRTADAGWQGKSRAAALRQSIIDGVTNSCEEGFRLEGFEGVPPALSSMDPLLDLALLGEDTKFQTKLRKKALRIMYQRMSAAQMLMHFLDVHQEPHSPVADQLDSTLAPIVVFRLTELALACRLVLIPQKWIGSSVALGFDCGQLPPRLQPEAKLREAVKVCIFDWGRSEFNTLEKHMALSDDEQKDRAQFWGYYKGGIDRLLYESTRTYWHRFGNSEGWDEACITVYDFDSMTDNDIVGKVTFAVAETKEVTRPLTDSTGHKAPTLTFSMEYMQLPEGSRLAGCWRVHVVRAEHLKACDRLQGRNSCDPMAVLEVTSRDKRQRFRQQTSVIISNLNPEWNETLEVPVATTSNYVEEALTEAASSFGAEASRHICAERISPLLPTEEAGRDEVEQALSGFRSRLDWACVSGSSRLPSVNVLDSAATTLSL